MGGTLKIRSEPSKGTRFVISLPLSLSIIHAVLFRLGEYTLAVPTNCVEAIESRGVTPSERIEHFCDLGNLMQIEGKGSDKGHIIRIRQPAKPPVKPPSHEKGPGIAADAIIGNVPLLAIPLGELLAKTGLFAGVGIMENGDISLILDLEKIQAVLA